MGPRGMYALRASCLRADGVSPSQHVSYLAILAPDRLPSLRDVFHLLDHFLGLDDHLVALVVQEGA